MGEVFLAVEHLENEGSRLVVAKRTAKHLLNGETEGTLQREARVASHLNHPNLVQILDFAFIEEEPHLIMEAINGPSVAELLQRTRSLSVPAGVAIVAQVANALHAVHEARDERGTPLSLVHRDVSPDNILLKWDGTVKLGDFGLAFSHLWTRLTRTGTVKGKLHYMSPEQLKGAGVDRRSDVYALGAVLFELLHGSPPFGNWLEEAAISHAVLFETPPELSVSIPPELRELLRAALAKDPSARPQSALEFAAALRTIPGIPLADVGETLAKAFPSEDPLRRRFAEKSDMLAPGDRQTRVQRGRNTQSHWPLWTGLGLTTALALAFTLSLSGRGSRQPTAGQAPAALPHESKTEPVAAPSVPPAPPPPLRASVKSPRMGTVQASTQVECTLHMDGKRIGLLRPGASLEVETKVGPHEARCQNTPLGLNLGRAVRVRSNARTVLNFQPQKATLRLKVAPWGEVEVDAKRLGISPIAPMTLYEGEHQVVVVHPPTGKRVTRRVVLEPDEVRELRISLSEE